MSSKTINPDLRSKAGGVGGPLYSHKAIVAIVLLYLIVFLYGFGGTSTFFPAILRH